MRHILDILISQGHRLRTSKTIICVPSLSQSTGASEEVIFSLVRYETEYLMSLIHRSDINSKEGQVPGPGESLICL